MFTLSSLLVLATSALAVRVSYDPVYDNRDQSLDTVLCSTGSNGLETKNFTTFGSLPNFPNIGGAEAVKGFNSPACGTCWALTYKNLTINVCVISIHCSWYLCSRFSPSLPFILRSSRLMLPADSILPSQL